MRPTGGWPGLQDLARDRWASGPAGLTDDELEARRYRLTALLDDLADETTQPTAPHSQLPCSPTSPTLPSSPGGHWSGTGGWLTRRLREIDPDLSEDLVAGLQAAVRGDASALENCGDAELKRIGGPLDSGYERHA